MRLTSVRDAAQDKDARCLGSTQSLQPASQRRADIERCHWSPPIVVNIHEISMMSWME